MRQLATLVVVLLCATSGLRAADAPRPILKAKVLPLALDDAFQFRKTKLFLNDPVHFKPTADQMIEMERDAVNFGAVTNTDRLDRRGHYFTFAWRADRRAEITVRLEYRQENLGSYVQAREVFYPDAKGTMTTKFAVTGDDYLEEGRIVAWRAVLIEKGKIVGLTQSFLWN
jgi:hypothetical protein